MFPLIGRQLARKLDVNRRVKITGLIRMVDGRHSVPLEPKHLTVLRAERNLQSQRFATERFHLSLATEHCRRQRDRDRRVQVFTLAFESWMRRESYPQVEIAPLWPPCFMLSLSRHAGAPS